MAPGECDIELPFKAELTREHGYFHDGIIGTIAHSSAFTLMFERFQRTDG